MIIRGKKFPEFMYTEEEIPNIVYEKSNEEILNEIKDEIRKLTGKYLFKINQEETLVSLIEGIHKLNPDFNFSLATYGKPCTKTLSGVDIMYTEQIEKDKIYILPIEPKPIKIIMSNPEIDSTSENSKEMFMSTKKY